MRSSVWYVAAGRIESDDRVSSAGKGGMPRGATTSSGRFAATVRGCRPPFAENSPPDCFPGAPGPQPGEGNTGCRPPFAVRGLVMIDEPTRSKPVQPTRKTS